MPSESFCQWLRNTIDDGKDGKAVGILLRYSPFRDMQTNSSGAGIVCVGGFENFRFKMLEITYEG